MKKLVHLCTRVYEVSTCQCWDHLWPIDRNFVLLSGIANHTAQGHAYKRAILCTVNDEDVILRYLDDNSYSKTDREYQANVVTI